MKRIKVLLLLCILLCSAQCRPAGRGASVLFTYFDDTVQQAIHSSSKLDFVENIHSIYKSWRKWYTACLVTSYYKSSSVCLFVCLSVCSLSPPRSFDRSSPNLVGVCRWTSELPLRGSFSKRSTARRVNGSLSLSTILYMCQPHSTQLQKATLLLLQLIRLKGTICCIDGWWVYVGGSRN